MKKYDITTNLTKDRALDDLHHIIIDIEAQINSLEQHNELDWSCIEKDNWEALLESVLRVHNYIVQKED